MQAAGLKREVRVDNNRLHWENVAAHAHTAFRVCVIIAVYSKNQINRITCCSQAMCYSSQHTTLSGRLFGMIHTMQQNRSSLPHLCRAPTPDSDVELVDGISDHSTWLD